MKRLLDAKYFDKEKLYLPLGHIKVKGKFGIKFPSAQEVSDRVLSVIHEDHDNRKQVSQLHMTFGQFIDHDMSLSNNRGGCQPAKCSKGGFVYPCFPIRKSSRHSGGKCSQFTRSFAVCKDGAREQVNVITSFIDGSLVYGNDKERHERLIGKNGFLLHRNGILPDDTQTKDMCKNREGGCFLAGDVRANEHIGLASLHTVFVRYHNYLVKELKKVNWLWGSKRIFNEARNILIATLQHITYKEFVPTLTRLKRYRGYKKHVDPRIPLSFSTAAFRYGHSQVKNTWSLLNHNFDEIRHVKLRDTYFNNSLIHHNGIEQVIYGLAENKSEAVDTIFTDGIAKHLFIPSSNKHGFQNLAALNIQRGRDHGLPGYNEWRRYLGLRPKRTFAGFRREIRSKRLRQRLRSVYRHTNNNIDLFVAGLAEKPVKGKLVGPTFGKLIKITFEDLRDGDRFWYQSKRLFSYRQYKQITKMTMAKVFCYTLKDIVSIQTDVFEVFNQHNNRRIACDNIPGINLKAWRETPRKYRYGRGFYRPRYYDENNGDNTEIDNDDNGRDNNARKDGENDVRNVVDNDVIDVGDNDVKDIERNDGDNDVRDNDSVDNGDNDTGYWDDKSDNNDEE